VTALLRTIPRPALLALLAPVVFALHVAGNEGVLIFVLTAVAILGTVVLIGKATEDYAVYAGPVWGGLMNATFGNVTELIIALFALRAGLFELVKSSITGSILGNLLLILGAAMFYGGLHHPVQKFSRSAASANVGMLVLALVALLVPSFIEIGWRADPALDEAHAEVLVGQASLAAAITLLVIYLLSLVFSLRTHRFLLMPAEHDEEEADWPKHVALAVLGLATVVVAFLSDIFVHSIESVIHEFGISEIFVGVIVVAIVGNAAEGSVAIQVARRNKMDLSFQIAMGSCLQVALLVAPVLVLASYLIGNPMTLAFNPFELMALASGVLIAGYALIDGESHWLEGAMFLAVYAFFAAVFWFHP
jgi:Ca2+:H+ antiporter